MNIALLGFAHYPEQEKELIAILTTAGHKIVSPAGNVITNWSTRAIRPNPHPAEMLIIPNHLDTLFPKDGTPWVAVIITGSARAMDFAKMENPPKEILLAVKPGMLSKHPEFLLKEIEKLS